MRAVLLKLLGRGARLQSSYLPGRCGFVITTKRPLAELRQALAPRWAVRLYPLHLPSGRLFLEPTVGALAAALQADRLEWWTSAHQQASAPFFCPARSERIRRLPPAARPTSHPVRGLATARALGMRLEALHATPKPDKHWRALAETFDRFWSEQALYTAPPNVLHQALFSYLRRCRTRHDLPAKGGIAQARPGVQQES